MTYFQKCKKPMTILLASVCLLAMGAPAYAQDGIPTIVLDPLSEEQPVSEQPPPEQLSEPAVTAPLNTESSASVEPVPPQSLPVSQETTAQELPEMPPLPEEEIPSQETLPQAEVNIIQMDESVQQPQQPQEPGVAVAPQPDQDTLVDLNEAIEAAETAATGAAPQQPTLTPAEDEEPAVFYDANDAGGPKGQLATQQSIIRKVDPVKEPASRYVIVDKEAKVDSVEAQLVAASRAIKLGRYDSALDLYNGLYEKNQRDPRVLMGRAVALQHLERFDEAMQAYEAFEKIDPDNIEARINMLGLLATRFPAVAQQRLKQLLEESPQNVGVLAQLAITEGKQGNYEGAMRYLGVASSLEPRNANHLYNMGVVSDRAGDRKAAVQFYEKALELDTIYGRGQSIPRELIYERLAVIR